MYDVFGLSPNNPWIESLKIPQTLAHLVIHQQLIDDPPKVHNCFLDCPIPPGYVIEDGV